MQTRKKRDEPHSIADAFSAGWREPRALLAALLVACSVVGLVADFRPASQTLRSIGLTPSRLLWLALAVSWALMFLWWVREAVAKKQTRRVQLGRWYAMLASVEQKYRANGAQGDPEIHFRQEAEYYSLKPYLARRDPHTIVVVAGSSRPVVFYEVEWAIERRRKGWRLD